MNFRFRLPDWVGNALNSGGDLEYLAMCYFKIYTAFTEMKKLKSGFLLKDMLDRFRSKVESTLTPDQLSLFMYFAHDITMTNMLNSLGLFKVRELFIY